jgi:CubicO group peptidase (beta-lactamase class C family)
MCSSVTRFEPYIFLFPYSQRLTDKYSPQIFLKQKATFNASYFNETILPFMQERGVPGLSVALTYDDRLIYTSSFGYADKDSNLLVTPEDRFRLASVSKAITSIAILYLVEQGLLSLSSQVFGNDSILGYTYGTKTFSPYELQITVQHLLEHTTGFVNDDMCGEGCDPTYLDKFLGLNQWDLVGALLDQYDPSHAPGTFASYSNFAFFIAGRVVEAVAGVKKYEDFIQNSILSKLGIDDMQIATDERAENEVVYYNDPDPKKPYSFHVHRRDSVGAWIATPRSLVKLLTAIDGLTHRPNLLNWTTLASLYEKSPVNGSDYAKGFTVGYVDGELEQAFKDGGYWGTNAYVNINFANKTSYAIVVNQEVPNNGSFLGGHDLKILMDNLTFGIEEWPKWDLF